MRPEVTSVLLEHNCGQLVNLILRNPKRRRQISELHTLAEGTLPQKHCVVADSRRDRTEPLPHEELVDKRDVEPVAVVPNEIATLQNRVHPNQVLLVVILMLLKE